MHQNITTSSRNSRWAIATVSLAGLAALLGAAPSKDAITLVYTCHCTDMAGHGYASGSRIPLFTGNNKLRIRGPNVNSATGVFVGQLPGSIKARRTVRLGDGSYSGELDVEIAVLTGTTAGDQTLRVKYLVGEDTYPARIVPRGTVARIEELPSRVRVFEKAWVKFSGAGIGQAKLLPAAYPTLPYKEVSTPTFTTTSYRTQIRFESCGTWPLAAHHLYHSTASSQEVRNRNALYLGAAQLSVQVVGCDTRPVVYSTLNRFGLAAPATVATPAAVTHNSCHVAQLTFQWRAVADAHGYDFEFRFADGTTRRESGIKASPYPAWAPNPKGPPMPAGRTEWRVRAYRSVNTTDREVRYAGPFSTARSFELKGNWSPLAPGCIPG